MRIENLLAHPPTAGRALYVDMNSFFASVEQQTKPELRGKPVGVCPFVDDRTSIIAASIEAKRCGIKTGTSVRDAKRLCPDIHLVSDNARTYREYHRKIMTALDTTRCRVKVKSIDEALLILPSDLRHDPVTVAHQVQNLIYEIGAHLGCSIGIASNMFLAKMGTKLHKPRGLVEIRLEDLEALYSTLALTDLYGISWRMARRLNALGIETTLDFYHTPYEVLKQAFGIPGERWYFRLRGYEVDQNPTNRVMIGHQTTLTPDPARTQAEVISTASQLCYKAAVRLRASNFAARSVHVSLRYTDRTRWNGLIRTHEPFWDSETFFKHTEAIIRTWSPEKPVRLVSVTAFDLSPQNTLTHSLFDPPERQERTSRALDELEARFGRHIVRPGIQLLGEQVSDHVGFGNAGQAAIELA